MARAAPTIATYPGTCSGIGAVVDDPLVGAGIAVGAAIAVMSLLRCLHPPGGGAALLAVIGSSVITGAPVRSSPCSRLFHRMSGHSYPHRTAPIDPAEHRSRFLAEDVDRAPAQIGEAFDISREDIGMLLREVESTRWSAGTASSPRRT